MTSVINVVHSDDNDDVVDPELPAVARPCSCCGNAASNCDKVECEFEAVELPTAWATAAACPGCAAAVVVGGGSLNGVSMVAADDDAA